MANSLNATNGGAGLAIDANSLNSLRTMSKDSNSDEALKGAAKQFEAIFLNMVMKSMREATPSESPFESDQSKMFLSMLDQEMTQKLADRGIGLAEVLVKQLSKDKQLTPEQGIARAQEKNVLSAPERVALRQANLAKYYSNGQRNAVGVNDVLDSQVGQTHVTKTTKSAKANKAQPEHVTAFIQKFTPAAQAVSAETGIPAKFILAHAALETGWGRKEIRGANGTTTHNLFGIKANAQWTGNAVAAKTIEYSNGVAKQQVEKFRSYDSYVDAFRDYAQFLTGNKRYQAVVANAKDPIAFAQGLQRAGYATDPDYAKKLSSIINQTLRA
jgi:flagellar protein FlgJ